MGAALQARPLTLSFLAGMTLPLAAALALAVWSPWREAATILLFVPLIWAFITRALPGMVVCGALVAAVRVAVEMAQIRAQHRPVAVGEVLANVLFVMGLYAALGLTLYFYRRRQGQLLEQMVAFKSREAMEQLAAGLAHDFNNALAVMVGTAQVMRADPALPEQAGRDLDAVLSAGTRASDLVRQLRQFSLARATGAQRRDLTALVEAYLAAFQRTLPDGVQLTRRYADGPLPVDIDPGQFDRLLGNLCTNACHAMPDGGTLTVGTAAVGRQGKSWALLEVADTGVGFSPAQAARLFEPFYTTRAAAGGTGLGLMVVRSVAQGHGGVVEVDGAPGRGATFRVLLPLAALPAPGPASAPATGP